MGFNSLYSGREKITQEFKKWSFSPSAPLLVVTQVTSTTIILQWPPVKGASFYNVLIRRQDSSEQNQELNVYGESTVLTDLSPDSTYCFSVFAVYTDKSGPESESVCAQTYQELTQ